MNHSLPRTLLLALWLLPLAATPNGTRAQTAASTRIVDAEQTRKAHSPPKGFKALKDYIVKELELQPGDVVVDIGAGDGFWSDLMAKQVGPTGVVHAGEVAQGKVDTMTKKFAALPQVRPYLCPTDGPGLPPASCDLAFISETYHHFDKGTQVAYLKGLRPVLKPNARLAIIERYTETGIGHGEHGTPLSRLVKEAEASGWVPLRVTMIPGTYHYLAILAPQDLFPAEKPRQDGKAKKKAAKKQPGNK
jgi:ubiquinone/menaquinone biosynthesis C-methylase UbiE